MDENQNIKLSFNELINSTRLNDFKTDDFIRISNLAPYLIIISDLSGKIVFFNQLTTDIINIPYQDNNEILSLFNLINFTSPVWENFLVKIHVTGEHNFDGTIQQASGLFVDVKVCNKVVNFSDQISRIVTFITLVSSRKAIHYQFLSDFIDKQMILDAIPALIFVKDLENRLVGMNKTFEEVTGLKAEQVISKKITEIIEDNLLAEAYWKNDLEVISSGIPKRNIIENLITDKSKWFITDKIPLHSETGEMQGILSYSVDITERKYAEESLMRSEQRFKLFFNTSPDAIILSTLDGKFLSANPAFEVLTGYNNDEIEDFTFQRITPTQWPKFNEEIEMAETLITDVATTLTIEKEYQRIDRTIVPVRVTGWIIRDEMSNPMQLCIYVKDLTFEKKADELEKSLLKKEKEQLSKDLEAKTRELSTKITQLIEKTELVGNVVTQLEKIIKKDNISISSEILTVIQDLKRNSHGNFWSQFEYTFGQINQSFYNNLFKTYPNLTNNEKKICAFLKMNLSTKDISTITHQSTRSIEIARSRLRIKMKLDRSENLPKFLSQF